jgi:membrane-bound lytic murein transglycosylase D
VRKGDSLKSIAAHYQISVAELKNANHLGAARLRNGQTLMIPGQGSRAPALESPRQVAQAERPSSNANGNASRSYKVKNGDNLWQIAHTTGVGVDDLKRWNSLDSHGVKPGQVLKLQGGQQLAARASGKSSQDAVTYYKVKQGDSMYLIAKRFNVEMQHIKRWNPRSAHALKPGQTLTLYLDTASR